MAAPAGTSPLRDLIDTAQGGLCRASDLVLHRRRHAPARPLATAVAALDDVLGGGLPRGVLTEIVGRTTCGRFATLMAALQQVTAVGELAALVDQGGHLDSRGADAAGIDLARLLWVRPRRVSDAVAAAELLVATGFPLVAVDLGVPPVRGRAPLAAWLRLARRTCSEATSVLMAECRAAVSAMMALALFQSLSKVTITAISSHMNLNSAV